MFPLLFVRYTFNWDKFEPNPEPLIFITPFITGDQDLGYIEKIETEADALTYVNHILDDFVS